MGGALAQILVSICSALLSTAVIYLAAIFAHPNPTRGGLSVIGVLIAAPAVVSMLWSLAPDKLRPASALLRRAILYYAAFGAGIGLFGLVAPVVGGSSLAGWAVLAGLLSPFLIAVALLIGVATPTEIALGYVHAVVCRIFLAAPVAIGLAFHVGYAFHFQNRMQTVAEGAPYCVGIFDFRSDGSEYYRPARFYDFTYLSLRMDEISSIGGNGSYRPGPPLVMEIAKNNGREIVIYDERETAFFSRGNNPGDGFAAPRTEVEGCRLR